MHQKILEEMHKMCAEHGYEPTSFMEKIAKAKLRLFGADEWERCPCDGQNPNRSCISIQCHQDITEKGRCHCNCYAKLGLGDPKDNE